jgi:hypothetical protein
MRQSSLRREDPTHRQQSEVAPRSEWEEKFDAVGSQYLALVCKLLQLPPAGELPKAEYGESSHLIEPSYFVPFLKTRIPSCDAATIDVLVDHAINFRRRALLIMLRSTHDYFGRQASLLGADLTECGKPTRLTLYAENDAFGDIAVADADSRLLTNKGDRLQRISDALTVIDIAADAGLRGERVLNPQLVTEDNALLSSDIPYCVGWLQSVFALPEGKGGK